MKKALLFTLIAAPILLGTMVLAHWINGKIDRKREAEIKAQEEAQKQEVMRIVSETRKQEILKMMYRNLVESEMWHDEKLQVHCDFPRLGAVQAVVIDDIDPQVGVGQYFAFRKGDRIRSIDGTKVFLSFTTWDDQRHETLDKLKRQLDKFDGDKAVVVERGGKEVEVQILVPPMPDERTLNLRLYNDSKKWDAQRKRALAEAEESMNKRAMIDPTRTPTSRPTAR